MPSNMCARLAWVPSSKMSDADGNGPSGDSVRSRGVEHGGAFSDCLQDCDVDGGSPQPLCCFSSPDCSALDCAGWPFSLQAGRLGSGDTGSAVLEPPLLAWQMEAHLPFDNVPFSHSHHLLCLSSPRPSRATPELGASVVPAGGAAPDEALLPCLFVSCTPASSWRAHTCTYTTPLRATLNS